MKLSKHIERNYTSISEFARSQGVLPSQAQRWLKRDCEWIAGNVWCKVTKQVKSNDDVSTTNKSK